MIKAVMRLLQSVKPDIGTSGMWFRGNTAKVSVTHETALTYSALWACTLAISDLISMMPFNLHVRKPEGGFRKNEDHYLHRLLNTSPNDEMPAMQFRQAITAHALLWGNGYAEIERDGSGRPVSLWPMPPSWVTPWRLDDALVYEVRPPEGTVQTKVFRARDVLHVRGLGWDGIVGYDVVRFHAQAIGNYIASEELVGSFFGNGAHMSGLISIRPNEKGPKLDSEALARLRDQLTETYTGSRNAFRIALINADAEFKPMTVHPEAAQLIESRKFNSTDCARIFRIPPHIIGDLERATFSNIEHQAIQFVISALMPWATRWEQEVDHKLFGRNLRREGYSNIDLSYLLRGDNKTRFESYRVAREWGFMNANEIREREDLPPIPGPAGSVYLVPLNFQNAEFSVEPPEEKSPPVQSLPVDPPPDSRNDAVRNVLRMAIGRALRRERHRMSEVSGEESFRRVMARQSEYLQSELTDALGAVGPLISVSSDAAARAVNAAVQWSSDAHMRDWLDDGVDADDVRADRLLAVVTDLLLAEVQQHVATQS